ncbi:hypothetical protein QN277_005279 [Acacia crassicarpa]|uniref:Uncharacterized protein n=1 Tax=Acacia crassicarpa TaxID=499986 RepID=A0AAE1MAY8_9FABA|nr:hypothetical protein QN277_005279 [Acacia crassicarpa]
MVSDFRIRQYLFMLTSHKPIIKKALSETQAFYYPFASRLREAPASQLMIDCNEEGVIFIEADARVTLEQFVHLLRSPFPCFEEILYDVPSSDGVINCPLLLFQVTRLKCGGLISCSPKP